METFRLCKPRFPLDIEMIIFSEMDPSASVETHHDPHSHAGEHEHHELGWWRKYIFSTDHKVIGIQYGLCGLRSCSLAFA
jgi:cytochrome c oxidase subunit 1